MTIYRVYFTRIVEVDITVEADDPDEAIERAAEEGVPSICAQCSGWNQPWTRSEGDEFEPESVYDQSTGSDAWVSPERWARVSDR